MIFITVGFKVGPEHVDDRLRLFKTPQTVIPWEDWARMGELEIPAGG
jgi:hypothetical protein